jgi:hypothetical protein
VSQADVADYLASVLIEFGRRDRANRVSWNDDHRHRYLVDILADLDESSGERRFRVMVHLGNYALWLGGIFPHYIEARRVRRGGPAAGYYDALGRRGFAMASGHALADHYHLEEVFQTTAERYPAIREALNGLSRRLYFPEQLH